MKRKGSCVVHCNCWYFYIEEVANAYGIRRIHSLLFSVGTIQCTVCTNSVCIYFQNYIEFNLANPDIQDDDLLKSLPHGARRSVLKNLYVPLLETVDILEVGAEPIACIKNSHVNIFSGSQGVYMEY